MEKNSISDLTEWKTVKNHFEEIKSINIEKLFAKDNKRGKTFSLYEDGIYFDYSKNQLTEESVDLLVKLAKKVSLGEKIEDLFNGGKVNATENRPALHTVSRDVFSDKSVISGTDVEQIVSSTYKKMQKFSNGIVSGERKGGTGKRIRNIVNIGIGGSYLGPLMSYCALKRYGSEGINQYFISNLDRTFSENVYKKLDPEETLFIIISKSFSTKETMMNAGSAVDWLSNRLKITNPIKDHFIAITAKKDNALAFGIQEDNVFEIGEWIGGRFSVSSAVNLSLMISLGREKYDRFLKGFHSVDNHFRYAPFRRNIPVLLGLIGIWNRNFFGRSAAAVIPYGEELKYFTKYLQQLEMESNGKSVDINGKSVLIDTVPVIFGDRGTNAQHSFFQLLHQGTDIIPVDFIGFARSGKGRDEFHDMLISNMIAQSEALAFGVEEEKLRINGRDEKIIPHLVCRGNRPSNTMVMDELSPYFLGKLIAIYEHKVFVQGVIWNIDSFDQWGVESGKRLSEKIFSELNSEKPDVKNHDSSTNALIDHYIKLKNKD